MCFPPIKFYKCSQGTLSLLPSWSLFGRLFSYIRAISNPLWGISHLYKIRNTFLRENFFGRSLTPLFQLLIDYFFNRFPMFWKKNEKNIRIRILKFLSNEPSNSALLRSSNFELFSVKFYEKNGNIWNHYCNRPVYTKYIFCLHWLIFLNTMLTYVRQISGKIGAFFHMLYLWNEFGEPHFFPFLTQVIVIIWLTAAIGWKTWMY